jgi:hypothetical protein
MESKRADLFKQLRTTYPEFTYESFSYKLKNRELCVEYKFNIGEKYFFVPQHILSIPVGFSETLLQDSLFRNIIFNLGMVEAISYWKAVCSPVMIIKAGYMGSEQIKFWEKLFLHGLGEFFHVNGIIPGDDLVKFICTGRESRSSSPIGVVPTGEVLIPVGGGKDSVVTLETLKTRRKCRPYIMNPRAASADAATIAGFAPDENIISHRTIDKTLLKLNEKGYLNGHTPFSAMLAFTTVLVAYLNGIREIALSNESSANEPTIPGTRINHQYSKSFEFENDFRDYLARYVTPDINYYSFLRPLNELQIAGLFSIQKDHFKSFRSCNVGSKTNSWCAKCSKCLFTFVIMRPFIGHDEMIAVFGADLLDDDELIPLLDQLSGLAEEKPFECVGTVKEVNIALRWMSDHYKDKEQKPVLIQHFNAHQPNIDGTPDNGFEYALKSFGEHNIPSSQDVNLLKSCLDDIKH